jgi:hypothetical protein
VSVANQLQIRGLDGQIVQVIGEGRCVAWLPLRG